MYGCPYKDRGWHDSVLGDPDIGYAVWGKDMADGLDCFGIVRSGCVLCVVGSWKMGEEER